MRIIHLPLRWRFWVRPSGSSDAHYIGMSTRLVSRAMLKASGRDLICTPIPRFPLGKTNDTFHFRSHVKLHHQLEPPRKCILSELNKAQGCWHCFRYHLLSVIYPLRTPLVSLDAGSSLPLVTEASGILENAWNPLGPESGDFLLCVKLASGLDPRRLLSPAGPTELAKTLWLGNYLTCLAPKLVIS